MHTHHRRPPFATYASFEDPTPGLIDISFLLLVFFLITTSLTLREVDVRVDLGLAEDPAPTRPLVIEVQPDGEVAVGPAHDLHPVGRVDGQGRVPGLQERLETYATMAESLGNVPAVHVRPRDEASHAHLVAVLDAVRAEGISQIGIEAGPHADSDPAK